MGSAVLEYMADHKFTPETIRLGLPDHFVEHGDISTLYNKVGLDTSHIANVLLQLLLS